jgi:PAS domain S-box-containing protein
MMKALSRFLFGTLRGRLIVGVAAVHAVMMSLFIVDLTIRQRAMLLDRQIEAATALSQVLATSSAGWIVADDIAGLQELVEAQHHHPEVIFIMLTNEQGRILAGSDKSRLGLYLQDLPREMRPTVLSSSSSLVDVAAPALVGGRPVGWARVGIGQQVAGGKLAGIIRSGVNYALAAILIGSAIAWIMGRRITRRLYAVQETINAVRSGDRLARSALSGDDEAAVLAKEFNGMVDALEERDAELRVGEERYRSLIQKVQTAIVVHDGHGRILTTNPLARELLGLSADQLLGKALVDPGWHFVREDGSVLPVTEHPVSFVLSTQKPLRAQVIGVSRPDRDEIDWMLVNAEPEYGDSAEIAQVIVSFVDITGRKRAEKALHRLNRELRAISNCNQVLVRAQDEGTLLSEICRIVCDEAGYRMAWVGYAENDDAKSIRPVAWAGVEEGYLGLAGLTWADTERGQGPSGMAIRTGESACIQDFATDPKAAPWSGFASQRGYRSSISLPLKDKSATTFGVLSIYSAEPGTFTPEETRLLEELAGDLAYGIKVLQGRIELKRTEQERLAHLHFVNSLDRINRAIQGTNDLEEMLSEVLKAELAIFGCDRAYLIHPCDPEAAWWSVPMECTTPDFPGANVRGLEIPMDPESQRVFRTVRGSSGPVPFGPDAEHPLPEWLREQFGVQSQLTVAIGPNIGKPWMSGMHQCTHARIWTPEEQRLFQEINRRLADALNSFLMHRDLQESEKRYRQVFENSPVSIWEEDFSCARALFDDLKKEGVTDIETYFAQHPDAVQQCAAATKIVDVNRAALTLHAANNRQELLAGLVDTFTPESFDAFRQELVCLWKGGIRMAGDAVVKTISGDRRNVTVYFSVCPGYEETLSKVLVSLIDTTDRKALETALRKSEQKFRSLAENSSENIFRYDRQCRIIYANQQVIRTLNGKGESFLGSTPLEWTPKGLYPGGVAEMETYQATLQRVITSGDMADIEMHVPDPLGALRTHSVRFTAERDQEGQIVGALAFGRDITEKARLEEQLRQAQKMEAIGQLAGGVAHDFNNILTAIIGFGTLAKMKMPPEDPQRMLIDHILAASDRAAQLTQSLLAFSRKQVLIPKPVDLNAIVKSVEKLLGRLIGEDIEFTTRLTGQSLIVMADAGQIEQVLMNLVTNARDAIPGGGRAFHLHRAEGAGEGFHRRPWVWRAGELRADHRI